ncbi:MAG TPA: hypothetical protein VHU44_09720 [Acidobacteriaceae bacterium]|nr:hypothetical protein [Acidobacteriaceae bacterium]
MNTRIATSTLFLSLFLLTGAAAPTVAKPAGFIVASAPVTSEDPGVPEPVPPPPTGEFALHF